MRKVFIIGIGAGNPDYVTVQAINALNEVDVFFMMDKGCEKEDLVRLRGLAYRAFLIGERFMSAADPGSELRAVLNKVGGGGPPR